MKRMIFSLILITFVVTLSADVYPLIFIGGGMTWISVADNSAVSDDLESVFGYMAGISIEVDQTAPLIMEYGTRFQVAGVSYLEDQYSDYRLEYTANLGYIDIFGKAKFEIPIAESICLFPFVGYAMGILLYADYELIQSSIWVEVEEYSRNGDFMKDCNALNHTLLFGTDILINDRFTIGVEYDLGISKILKYDKPGFSEDSYIAHYMLKEGKTSALMFKVGLLF